ncbi:hypothetical protein Peetri_00202 [Pseudomonas phage vB_PpuM-Peetri]
MQHYPVYPYHSAQAVDFRKTFAEARAAGLSEFTWEGRRYNTKLAGE